MSVVEIGMLVLLTIAGLFAIALFVEDYAFLITAIVGWLLILTGPFALLWAVNTLFGVGLAYSWTNWFAVAIVTGTLSSLMRGVSRGQ